MGKQFEILLFDVDNTLINLTDSQNYAVKEMFKFLKVPLNEQNYYPIISKEFWDRVSNGEIKAPNSIIKQREKDLWILFQWLNLIFDLSGRLNMRYLDKEFELFYEKFCTLTNKNIAIIPDVEKTIDMLSHDYRLIIASNGDIKSLNPKLIAANIKDYFPKKNIFFASELKSYKPHKEFFYRILEKLNISDVSKVAMIGDSYHSDIQGAINAGIQPIWFDFHNESNCIEHNIPKSYICNSFEELLKIL